jgi:hypothetical protein
MRLETLGKVKKFNDLTRNRIRDLTVRMNKPLDSYRHVAVCPSMDTRLFSGFQAQNVLPIYSERSLCPLFRK